ncbi:calcitonin gene-related peptide type 1 receptor isoform X2 [Antennarius striatus]|uniref:calcitonin gene-related peptide type 1 receptor isoform X2 n=1 Tax=Antennarius striatus TaxID=241820 RepID=UPI0035AFCB78
MSHLLFTHSDMKSQQPTALPQTTFWDSALKRQQNLPSRMEMCDTPTRSAAGKSSTSFDMPKRRMESIGRNGAVALILLCNLQEVFVKASLEVNETQQQHPNNVYHDMGLTRNKIVTAQFECYQKIMKDNTESREEPVCNRTWDGWLCWDDTRSGVISEQHCPDYFQDFDPSEMVTKICTDSGHWFLHPESNRTWTNYTRCNEHTNEGRVTAMNLFYLALIGHGLSLTSLFVSLGIFFHFKSLSCQRITLHKNLFFSFVLNSVITIIWLTAVANNQELVQRNPTSCKVSQFIHLYLFGCNYFWMLCEGIYLHTLIVVAVFAEKQHLMWYYLLGWGFPLIPASIHAIARSYYYNDNCWISSKTSLLYIIHGPICAALLVNLFFLLNIVRVLITKLKVTHQAESSLYMKAVRATLILVPLLGIQYVLLPYKPEGRVSSEIYDYIMHILMHYQGLLVATIFCFFNGEVQAVLRRHWNQYNVQFGSSVGNHSDAMRSASYTASSITEVQGCYSIDGHTEHMNGRGFHDADAAMLKSDSPFA